ncbi:MAG: hypothetical protein NDI77_10970 [Geobacteraceae bacterium]|nr:hypothetical protein [Geobacteraceae bacterium]
MKTIELTEQEAESLASILEFYLSELRMEIADTERIAMRAPMKGEELFIKDLLIRLRGGEKA